METLRLIYLTLMIRLASSSCTPGSDQGSYTCVGNDTSSAPVNTTDLELELQGSDIDVTSMGRLTQIVNLKFEDAGFPVLKSYDFTSTLNKLKTLAVHGGAMKRFDFTSPLNHLEALDLRILDLEASVSTINFSYLPQLKVLNLALCNLTEFPPITGQIKKIHELNIYSNPHLDVNSLEYEGFDHLTTLNIFKNKVDISTMRRLPQSLSDLKISVDQRLKPEDFTNLTELRKLTVSSEVNVEFSTLSTLTHLEELKLLYELSSISLVISNCPANLSKIILHAPFADLTSLDVVTKNNTCSDDLELRIWSFVDCNCDVFKKLSSTGISLLYECSISKENAADVCKTPPPSVSSTTPLPYNSTAFPPRSSSHSIHLFCWTNSIVVLLTVLGLMS